MPSLFLSLKAATGAIDYSRRHGSAFLPFPLSQLQRYVELDDISTQLPRVPRIVGAAPRCEYAAPLFRAKNFRYLRINRRTKYEIKAAQDSGYRILSLVDPNGENVLSM